jgi:hypothetical protein
MTNRIRTKAELIERARRRARHETKKARGAHTRNWATRPQRPAAVTVRNAADLSPDERAKYGL